MFKKAFIIVVVFTACSQEAEQKHNYTQFWKHFKAQSSPEDKLRILDSFLNVPNLNDTQQVFAQLSKINPLINLAKYDTALSIAHICQKKAVELNYDSAIMVSLHLQGNIMYSSNSASIEIDQKFWHQALNIARKKNYPIVQAQLNNNIGASYYGFNTDSGIYYLKEAIHIYEKHHITKVLGYFMSMRVLATFLTKNAGTEEAIIALYDSVYRGGEILKDTQLMYNSLLYKCDFYLNSKKNKDPIKAQYFIDSVYRHIHYFKDFGVKKTIENYMQRCLYDRGKYKQALDSYYFSANTSAYWHPQELNQKMAEMETRFQTGKVKTNLIEAQLNLSRTQRNWALAAAALLLVMGTGVFYFFYSRKRTAQTQSLLLQKIKNQSIQELAIALEKERVGIARELHDGIVQNITAISLKLKQYVRTPNASMLTEAISELDHTGTELRSISHQMMPPVLESFGLNAAIKQLLQNSLPAANISHNYLYTVPQTVEIAKSTQHTLYRIVQELVQNMVKHSRATHLELYIRHSDNNVVVFYEDNGIGIQNKAADGKGLENLASRLQLLNGHMSIENEQNGSLFILIRIPI
ncbi:MAG: hypothetical protein IT244_09905 [Bacteroidia bacterium]|nr:hypothetical protein [Bacteroidia bacterium]